MEGVTQSERHFTELVWILKKCQWHARQRKAKNCS